MAPYSSPHRQSSREEWSRTPSTNSLSAYFKETAPELEKRISDAIDNSIARIKAIPEPFIENYQNENCGAAIEAIEELDTALSLAIEELTK